MNDSRHTDDCAHAEELVAHVYGETTPARAASFRQHLAACDFCRDELEALSAVRAEVGLWRASLLEHAPTLDLTAVMSAREAEATRALPAPGIPRTPARLSAAVAALREFFTLSPAWLRAASVAAVLFVCMLAALAVTRAEVRWDNHGFAFRTGVRPNQSATATNTTPEAHGAQAELERLAAERDAALNELAETRRQLDDSREANLLVAAAEYSDAPLTRIVSDVSGVEPRRTRAAAPAAPRRARTGTRLRNERDEEDLPRLSDLLGEVN